MTDSKHVERGSKGRARSCVVSGFPKHEGSEAIPHETTRACAYLSKGRMGGRLLVSSLRRRM